jgi:hypothetical protein
MNVGQEASGGSDAAVEYPWFKSSKSLASSRRGAGAGQTDGAHENDRPKLKLNCGRPLTLEIKDSGDHRLSRQRHYHGPGGLNGRVRNGNGCDPASMFAGKVSGGRWLKPPGPRRVRRSVTCRESASSWGRGFLSERESFHGGGPCFGGSSPTISFGISVTSDPICRLCRTGKTDRGGQAIGC